MENARDVFIGVLNMQNAGRDIGNMSGGEAEPSEWTAVRWMGGSRADDLTPALKTVIDWIAGVNYHARHNAISQRRCNGTGDWFLKTEKYLAWAKSSCGKLWVNAMRESKWSDIRLPSLI